MTNFVKKESSAFHNVLVNIILVYAVAGPTTV